MKHEHDSVAWRAERNAKMSEWVRDGQALRWLLDYYDLCEVIDDLADNDKCFTTQRIERIVFTTLIDYAANPFWIQHHQVLVPVVHAGINAWLDANLLERQEDDDALHLSFVLRDNYMAVTQTVIELVSGRQVMRELSLEITKFFSACETFPEYRDKLHRRARGDNTIYPRPEVSED